MKNIEITVKVEDKELIKYVSDIVPSVGDCIKIPEKGTYCVNNRIFLATNNRVILSVELLIL